MKLTVEQLIDALVSAGVVYRGDAGVFAAIREDVDLKPYIWDAADILNKSTNAPGGQAHE